MHVLWRSFISDTLCIHVATLWANTADDKLMIFSYFFPRKQVLTFHANCRVHPWGRFGRKSLPKLADFSLSWAEGEVKMYRMYRKIQNLDQNFSLKSWICCKTSPPLKALGWPLKLSQWRQFAWNVNSCFLGKIRKLFRKFVCWIFYPQC